MNQLSSQRRRCSNPFQPKPPGSTKTGEYNDLPGVGASQEEEDQEDNTMGPTPQDRTARGQQQHTGQQGTNASDAHDTDTGQGHARTNHSVHSMRRKAMPSQNACNSKRLSLLFSYKAGTHTARINNSTESTGPRYNRRMDK